MVVDFSYDVPSNRIKRKANGTDSVTCIYDAMNRLTKRVQDGTVYGYTYDKRGNLTEERLYGSAADQDDSLCA